MAENWDAQTVDHVILARDRASKWGDPVSVYEFPDRTMSSTRKAARQDGASLFGTAEVDYDRIVWRWPDGRIDRRFLDTIDEASKAMRPVRSPAVVPEGAHDLMRIVTRLMKVRSALGRHDRIEARRILSGGAVEGEFEPAWIPYLENVVAKGLVQVETDRAEQAMDRGYEAIGQGLSDSEVADVMGGTLRARPRERPPMTDAPRSFGRAVRVG